jgi:hypothetical protein
MIILTSTRGQGFEVMYARGPMARQLTLGVELRQLKDRHEERKPSLISTEGRDYVLGKLNNVTLLTPLVGMEWALIPRSSLNPITMRGGLRIGPAIGLVNPYYLEIFQATPNGMASSPSIEAYDPNQHSRFNISGRPSLSQLPFTPSVQVGLSLAAYALIDFSHTDKSLQALRLGAHADGFGKALPLLVESESIQNQSLFLSFSAALQFGSRW